MTKEKDFPAAKECFYMVIVAIILMLSFMVYVAQGQTKIPGPVYLVSDSALKLLTVKSYEIKDFTIKPNTDHLYLIETDTTNDVEFNAQITIWPKYRVLKLDDTMGSGWSQGVGHSFSNVKDRVYTLNFTGAKIQCFGDVYYSYGKVAISIDNGPETIVNLYKDVPIREYNVKFFERNVPYGSHIIKMRIVGEVNPKGYIGYGSFDYAMVKILN